MIDQLPIGSLIIFTFYRKLSFVALLFIFVICFVSFKLVANNYKELRWFWLNLHLNIMTIAITLLHHRPILLVLMNGTFVCPCFMTLCSSYLLKELITIGCMWNWSSEFLKEELLFANFGESHHTDNLFIVDSPLTSDSLSVVSRGSKARHPVITIWRPMREFGRVTVTTKLGEQS